AASHIADDLARSASYHLRTRRLERRHCAAHAGRLDPMTSKGRTMTASTVTDAQLLTHAEGCLLGVALGDAMGMPGELWPRDRVRAHFTWIEEFLPGPDGHFVVDGFVAGQVTDDTQQTYMLAEAIIDGGGEVQV